MTQALLIAPPVTPFDWCDAWNVSLLEEIPHPGLATSKDWAGHQAEARRWPGRNHPRAGQWLRERYSRPDDYCADPMAGVGGLWIGVPKRRVEYCEIEKSPATIRQHDARTWRPFLDADLVMFSPPFLQNHSAGAGEHQQEIRNRKGLHSMQEFGASEGNLGRMKPAEFWPAMLDVYRQVRTYTTNSGVMVVILRNMIRQGHEVQHVGEHVRMMRAAGWNPYGAHPRTLRPTGYTQFKVARDPSTPWIKTEWAIVAEPLASSGGER